MNLQEAIEILDQEPITCELGRKPKLDAALKLGIKAIERFRNLRDAGKDVGMPLLKGETQD